MVRQENDIKIGGSKLLLFCIKNHFALGAAVPKGFFPPAKDMLRSLETAPPLP